MDKENLKPTNVFEVSKQRKRVPPEQWTHQNIPIKSELKMHRIYQLRAVNETCWAYMKLLREHNNTKKVYDIDPYCEVYQFRENVYGILTENISGMGDPWMYVIDGPEKVMLIDTAYGLGDLKGLVKEICGDKEIICVNTHCHMDHANGDCQFDKIYCSEYEVPFYNEETYNEHMHDYLFDAQDGKGIWAEFDKNDLVPYKPFEVIGCPDGYVFDLGQGYEVELVHLGGHTPGQAGFLDKMNRIFFAGDDILCFHVYINVPEPGTAYPEKATVRELGKNMDRLSKRLDEFDHVFTGHWITDIESIVIKYMAEACEEVVNNPADCAYTDVSVMGTKNFKYVKGLGCLAYPAES